MADLASDPSSKGDIPNDAGLVPHQGSTASRPPVGESVRDLHGRSGPVVCRPPPHRSRLWWPHNTSERRATPMTMTPRLRKFALTAHVTSSIGWFGAVAAFEALAIAGMISQDAQLVRAAYLAMELITWFVIVPLAVISLLSGVVSSLGTSWGLFRYHWVLLKLLITVLATIVLLVHMQPIDFLAGVAANTTAFSVDLQSLQLLMVTASSAALVVLILLTVLSVYKPRGMTRHGARRQDEQRALSPPPAAIVPLKHAIKS
jgi:hypothetical protein